MEKLLELIRQEKYQEACEGFRSLYLKTHNPYALYYSTLLEYLYLEQKDYTSLSENFRKLIRCKRDIREASYSPFLSLLLELEAYPEALDVSKKALSEHVESFMIHFAYASGLYRIENRSKDAVSETLQALKDESIDQNQKFLCYDLIIEIYRTEGNLQKARDYLNKVYLLAPNTAALHLLELKQALAENDEQKIEQYKKLTFGDEETRLEALRTVGNFCFDRHRYEEAINCYEQLKELLSAPYFAERKILLCLLKMKRFDDCFRTLDSMDPNDPDVRFLYGYCYQERGYKQDLLHASRDFLRAYELSQDPDLLEYYGESCYCMKDLAGLEKAIHLLKKKKPQSQYVHLLKADLAQLKQRFHTAEKEIRILQHNGSFTPIKLAYEGKKYYRNPTLCDKIYAHYIQSSDESVPMLRSRIIAYLYGEYGTLADILQAEKAVHRLEHHEENNNCSFSVIGAFYLQKKEYQTALTFFREGDRRYTEGTDSCQCCSGYLSYCYLMGLGVERNIEKAFSICSMIREKEQDDLCENVACLYAECAMLLNKEMEAAYDLLEKSISRRYATPCYFTLIRLGKRLNRRTGKYKRHFQASLKHTTDLEAKYYLTDPKIFMMNNY